MLPIKKFIDDLKEDGKWKYEDGSETFVIYYYELIKRGISDEIARDILESLYNAVANEFGNY